MSSSDEKAPQTHCSIVSAGHCRQKRDSDRIDSRGGIRDSEKDSKEDPRATGGVEEKNKAGGKGQIGERQTNTVSKWA